VKAGVRKAGDCIWKDTCSPFSQKSYFLVSFGRLFGSKYELCTFPAKVFQSLCKISSNWVVPSSVIL
jgi:hypothetical protein